MNAADINPEINCPEKQAKLGGNVSEGMRKVGRRLPLFFERTAASVEPTRKV